MYGAFGLVALAATGASAWSSGGWVSGSSSGSSSSLPAYSNTTSVPSGETVTVIDVITKSTTVCPTATWTTEVESTSTVYETVQVTITACASSVSNCPASSTYVSYSTSTGYTVVTTTATIGPGSSVSGSSVSPVTASASSSAPASVAPSASSSLATASSASASTTPVPSPTISATVVSNSTSSLAPSSTPNYGQVGNSTYGTLGQGCLPKWLPKQDGSPYLTAPWGNRTTKNSDATVPSDIPQTNVTRYYDFTISRARISPDGVLRDVILINGQYPAPQIEANWGDMITVTVHNNINSPEEGTSLHWHGQLQKGTQWEDGVPAIGQCPIAPGASFTYTFQAQNFGSSWYHAHYSAQYTAGLAGPMIIYGPTQAGYEADCDIGFVGLSDWYHIPYFSIVKDAVSTNLSLIPPTSDSVLINGRGQFNCSEQSYDGTDSLLASNLPDNLPFQCTPNATVSKFNFKAGKTHRLRLVNYGADGIHKFSIDGLKMTVISIDYVPIVPYTTDVVTLGVAQRSDVLVTAPNNTQASYWMRTEDIGGAFCGGSANPLSLAAIYNEDADTSVLPTTVSTINNTICANDALSATVPDYAITPSTPSYQQDLSISLFLNSTGSYEWRLNNQSYHANFNNPILFKAAVGNVSYPDDPQWNVYNFDQNSSVIFNLSNTTPFTHPFHMHGHNFYVLDEGVGAWNGTVVNGANPARRDTQLVQALGYAVIQMEADNPGVWPFHCHVAWHLSGGLAINIMSKPSEIGSIPEYVQDTCTAWDTYSNSVVVDQIDAGS